MPSAPDAAPETGKALVHAYVEAFNQGDFERLRRLFTDDALIWGVLGWGPIDEVVPIWRELHEALALTLTVEALVAEGDTVAARYTERGVARAPFRDKPATGRPYELAAMEFFEIADGKIRRRWGARDGAGQARQLGW